MTVWRGRLLQRCREQKGFRDRVGAAAARRSLPCVDSPAVSRACLRDTLLSSRASEARAGRLSVLTCRDQGFRE